MNTSRIRRRGVVGSLIALLALAGPAGAVPRVTQVIDGLPQVIAPQQIIVECDPASLPIVCSNALALVGATVVAVGQTVFNLVQLPAGVPLQGALDTLRAATGIASAEPNRIFLGSTAYPQTWHFPAAGAPGDSTLLFASVPAPVVAVLDTGVAYENYFDLSGTYAQAPVFSGTQFAQGWDFVNGDAHANDDNGHGSAMASIIAGQGFFSPAAIPYVGPAAGAVIMPIKVLDSDNRGTEFSLAEGIRFAVSHGARVINLSLDFARNYTPGVSMTDAIAQARANHVVIAGASGNTSSRVLHPAAFPDVLSVGAFTLDAVTGYAVSYYSNTGEALDLVGPGGDPRQDVNLDGLFDGALGQAFPPGSPTNISWWDFAGTSPATAHVSAAAAVLIGAGVAPDAVRPLLLATADSSISRVGWDRSSGSGRVQAASALAQASTFVAPAPLYADAVAALRSDGRASGAVMIADASGNPVANAEVLVRWRGAAPGPQRATTDASGIARFVSPWPISSRKIFLIEVPRVIFMGTTQRPRAFARSSSGFGTLTPTLTFTLGLNLGGATTSVAGLDIWGNGYSGGVGIASGTTGSGIASGTTGSNGDGNSQGQSQSYPLTTGIAACPIPFPLYSYGPFSFSASDAFFSGAFLASGLSVRTIDTSWVVTPGAAALDSNELGRICGISASLSTSLSTGYFTTGTLFVAGSGSQPPGFGAGYNARFWSEVLNAEGATDP
jgi:Subtilase family